MVKSSRTVCYASMCAALSSTLVLAAPSSQAPPEKLPVILTWSSTITSTETVPNGPEQHSVGVAAYQQDAVENRSAWVSNRNPYVVDFNKMAVYFVDGRQTCQYFCKLLAETPCNSQMDGNALCGYDYENRAKFIGEETLPQGQTYHYHFGDPLGIIPMADHDMYLSTTTLLPVRYDVDLHPFGKEVGKISSLYTNFSTATPDAKYFIVGNEKYCQEGSDAQCQDTMQRIKGTLPVMRH